MSFEETLVCDGCSSVLSGGPRRETVPELLASGGRAFMPYDSRRRTWVECGDDTAPENSLRHLCAGCSGATEFFDGTVVPAR